MTPMPKRVQEKNERPHTLIGTWVNGDEYETEVEYIVSPAGEGFAVRAVDRFDGEEGEVYDVKWEGSVLSFAVHWNSTGRLVKARLLAISPMAEAGKGAAPRRTPPAIQPKERPLSVGEHVLVIRQGNRL